MTYMGDWPSWTAPTTEQIAAVRDHRLGRAEGRRLPGMHAELRHLSDRTWSLRIVDPGREYPVFVADVESEDGAELTAARARLDLAGRPAPRQWRRVEGGWDGPVG